MNHAVTARPRRGSTLMTAVKASSAGTRARMTTTAFQLGHRFAITRGQGTPGQVVVVGRGVVVVLVAVVGVGMGGERGEGGHEDEGGRERKLHVEERERKRRERVWVWVNAVMPLGVR